MLSGENDVVSLEMDMSFVDAMPLSAICARNAAPPVKVARRLFYPPPP